MSKLVTCKFRVVRSKDDKKSLFQLRNGYNGKIWSVEIKQPYPIDHDFWLRDEDDIIIRKFVARLAEKHNAPTWAYLEHV